MSAKPDPQAIAPRWAKPVIVVLAVLLAWFALDRYIGGLEMHKRAFDFLAPDYGEAQLDVLASRPASEFLHRIGGTILLAAGLLQFSAKLRRERPKLHRVTGYIYVTLALSAGCSGIYLGLRAPFGGVLETIPAVIFGAALIVTTVVALRLARQRRFEVHREWMVRSFAFVLGPISMRVYYLPMWSLFGVDELDAMWIAFWLGWLSTWIAAELWIAARKRRWQALRESKAQR
ncbi:MAG TPA: DUF2306 domain-containing protein [Enhygromyxa sp.]|nr:DUF2306 domain-containing protein [Enhygromyxa sp.]